MEDNNQRSGRLFDSAVLRQLLSFTKPYQLRFGVVIFLTLVSGALGPFRVFLINDTVDNYIGQGDSQGLLWMTLAMVGLLLVQSLAQYTQTYQSGWLGQSIIRDIRLRLYKHILSLRLRFFDNTQIGRLITRNISDVETLSDVFTEGLAAMAGDVLQLAFILGFMFYTNWKLTLVSLSTFPLLIISTYVFKEKIKSSFNEVRSAVANLNTFVQEHITGMFIVQLFHAEKREYSRFEEINKTHRDANIRSVLYYSVYFPIAEVIGAMGTGLLVWYGAGEVIQEEVTLGTLIAFIMYIQMFFRPIRAIADRFNTLQLGVVSAERIFKLLDNTDYISSTGNYKPATIKGEVVFEKVNFEYKENQPVLNDISFKVEAGKTLAMVGATGAGKSSIVNLINRFYDIKSGTISVDGISIEEYDLNTLRSHIGLVLQDVFLFGGSVYENITLGNNSITRERVKEAAELLGAWEFIEKLPNGLDYDVMERGATLSVGQRQLISFVRAMVYNPGILILDEATSSVDSETEATIQKALEVMLIGRTSIVIAHRLSTIQNADQILVLDKGKIIERGTHNELLEQNGAYAQLYRLQYKEIAA